MYISQIILIAASFATFAYGGRKISVEKAVLETVDPEYLNVKVDLRKDGENSVIDVNADVLKDLGADLFIQVIIQKKSAAGEYQNIFKSDVTDRCHFVDNREKYPVLNMLAKDMDKYGNLLQKCPVNKGNYYLKGYIFELHETLEKQVQDGEYCIHFLMLKEIETQMKTLFSIKWFVKA